MMTWLYEQAYNFNFLETAVEAIVITISVFLSKSNTYEEIAKLSQEVYKNAEETKDTIRDFASKK